MTLSNNHICDVPNAYGAKLSTENISSIYHTIFQRGSEGIGEPMHYFKVVM
jgi:hypothetical protein